MRVLHLSDVHLPAGLARVPLRDWLGKRLIGLANHRLRRHRLLAGGHRKLQGLERLCEEEEIGLVIFTGDYTHFGTEIELAAARLAFAGLMARPLGFVNLPGNHDLYTGDTVRQSRFERHFGETLWSDLPEYAADGPWPLIRLVEEGVAVLALNSARPNPQPWRSSGRIPEPQLEALHRVLGDPRLDGRFLFVATHYAPRLPDGRRDSRLHGLENAEAFLRAVAGVDRGAVLHGHVHHCYHLAIPGVAPPLFNAGSATLAGREGCWVFDVAGSGATVRRGRWAADRWLLDPPAPLAA